MIFRRKKPKITRLTTSIHDFVFHNVTGSDIYKVLIDDFEKLIQVTPDGGDITIETDDYWKPETQCFLVHDDETTSVMGKPVGDYTYFIHHS